MRALFLFALVIGSALSSPCSEVVPNKTDDCLSVYSDDSICCFRREVVDTDEKVYCVDKNVTYSGKSEYEETTSRGVKTRKELNCNIKIDFCGPITASKAKQCFKAKLPNGQCCFDKKQEVCFSYPYHFKSEEIQCENKKKEEEKEKEDSKPKWEWPWKKKTTTH